MSLKFPKPAKRISDPGHLSRMRELPCLTCGAEHQITAHHLLRNVGHAMGRKAGDNFSVPLCMVCHDQLHRNGDEVQFFADRQIFAPKELSETLYKHSRDRDMCLQLIRRFK